MNVSQYLLAYYQLVMVRIISGVACFISLTDTGRHLIRALRSTPDNNENE